MRRGNRLWFRAASDQIYQRIGDAPAEVSVEGLALDLHAPSLYFTEWVHTETGPTEQARGITATGDWRSLQRFDLGTHEVEVIASKDTFASRHDEFDQIWIAQLLSVSATDGALVCKIGTMISGGHPLTHVRYRVARLHVADLRIDWLAELQDPFA